MRWIVLLAAAGVLASGPAAAQDAELRKDARCLLVAAVGAQATPEQQSQLLAASLYYLGRIDGRGGGDRLQALIMEEAQKFSASAFQSEAQRCSELLKSRGAEMNRIGAAMKALEPKP